MDFSCRTLLENCVFVVQQWWMIRSTPKCQSESTLWTSEFPVLRAFSFSTSETKEEKSFNLKVFPISAEFSVRMKSNRKSGPWKMIFGNVFGKEFVLSSWKKIQKAIWSRNHHNRSTSAASGAPWHQNSNAPSNFRAARVRIRWKNEFLRWWKLN